MARRLTGRMGFPNAIQRVWEPMPVPLLTHPRRGLYRSPPNAGPTLPGIDCRRLWPVWKRKCLYRKWIRAAGYLLTGICRRAYIAREGSVRGGIGILPMIHGLQAHARLDRLFTQPFGCVCSSVG